jgi:RNA polymerase sigma-70 factor (ECF subfamily)
MVERGFTPRNGRHDDAIHDDDALANDPRLTDHQPYWAARAGLLARTGEADAADAAYERAIGLEADPAVRRFLERRRAELRGRSAEPTGSA